MKKLLTLPLTLLMAFSLCLTVSADAAVAKDSNGGEYNSLSDAFSNASDGSTITLESDNTLSDSIYVNDKSFTLDLNGKTLTINGGYLVFDKNITIKDSSTDSAGKILVTGHSNMASAGIIVRRGAEFILESGTIKNTCNESQSTIAVNGKQNGSDASKVTINGGKIESVHEPCILASYDGPIVEINGGTLLTSNYVDVIKTGDISSNVSITVKGGTFSSDMTKYLAKGYSAVGSIQEDGTYTYTCEVINNNKTITNTFAAINSEARTILDNAGSAPSSIQGIKSGEFTSTSVPVSSSTKFIIETDSHDYSDDEEEKVEATSIDGVYNLQYIPLDITLKAFTQTFQDGSNIPFWALFTINDLGTKESSDIEIPVTLYLNQEMVSVLTDKVVKVIRIHNGETKVLDATLNGNTLTFNSGKFSTYVIAYGTSSSSGGNTDPVPSTDTTTTTTTSTKSYDAKDKNKDGVVSCEEEMNSANWIWSDTKQACVYKVTNTSAK